MKKIGLYISIIATFYSCGNAGDEADAFGNFETDEYTISSEQGGKLTSFLAQEGRELSAGQLVAVVDTTQLYLRKMQMKSSIDALYKKLPNEASQLAVFDERVIKLRTEIKRVTALVAANASPTKALDDLNAELEIVQRQKKAAASTLSTQTRGMLAEVEPMRFQLLQIEDQIQKCYVRNPVDGVVLTSLIQEGELALPGRPLYTIAKLDPLILRAYASEDLLGQIKIGQSVNVGTDGPEGTLVPHRGILTWISSEAEFTPKIIQTRDERVTQVYAIKIEVANDGSLKIGMPAEVYFKTADK